MAARFTDEAWAGRALSPPLGRCARPGRACGAPREGCTWLGRCSRAGCV